MQQTLTLEEYLALPEEKPYREFIHGRAVAKPMTNTDHGNLVNSILFSLTLYARRLGGKVAPEISVLLGAEPDPRVLLPDAAYWAPGRQRRGYPSNPPTVAVEVRSPSQTRPEQREKCRFYVEHGVEAALLIDPIISARPVRQYFPATLQNPGQARKSATSLMFTSRRR